MYHNRIYIANICSFCCFHCFAVILTIEVPLVNIMLDFYCPFCQMIVLCNSFVYVKFGVMHSGSEALQTDGYRREHRGDRARPGAGV